MDNPVYTCVRKQRCTVFVYKSPSDSSIIAADGDHRPLALADRGSIIFAVTSLNGEEKRGLQVFTMALDR